MLFKYVQDIITSQIKEIYVNINQAWITLFKFFNLLHFSRFDYEIW